MFYMMQKIKRDEQIHEGDYSLIQFFPTKKLFNSGFFGALIGGYLVAFAVYWSAKKDLLDIPHPPSLRGVCDIVLIPALTALAARRKGVLMFVSFPLLQIQDNSKN
jgi:fructose-specific phosphotransferase system IIC component